MPLPNTVIGTVGFLIFIGFIVALVVPSLSSNQGAIDEATTDFRDSMNNTVNGSQSQSGFWGFVGEATGTSGYYDFFIGFFQTIISLVQLILAYFGIYLDILSEVPTPFYVIFLILIMTFIIGIVKIVFGGGD